MSVQRTDRLNSLLKQVLSDVIRKDVDHRDISPHFSITKVEITKDLHHAKVYVSVIGTEEERKKTIEALQVSAKYIGSLASKQVVMRFFPSLTFYLDTSLDDYMKIDSLLQAIHQEKEEEKEKEENA